MKKICQNCRLVNFRDAENCLRCQAVLVESISAVPSNKHGSILKRAIVCIIVCLLTLLGFYISLFLTSNSLSAEEKLKVANAIKVLEEKGFTAEVVMLKSVTAFRSNDNWLNASTKTEDAYAATNFPFQIVTVYPEFFQYPQDDTERAAVLLHEAQHLFGKNEKEAYEYVWRQRRKLGWTKENYRNSALFIAVRKQTVEFAPNLFNCELGEMNDCTDY